METVAEGHAIWAVCVCVWGGGGGGGGAAPTRPPEGGGEGARGGRDSVAVAMCFAGGGVIPTLFVQ